MGRSRRGIAFTLIELLMVVAIIAILAAIAVPNFLEAQTRAKVSRAKADMATIRTGLESYAVDNNRYPPNDGLYNVVPAQLTTPVAYLSTKNLVDPFASKEVVLLPGVDPDLAKYYTYTKVVTLQEFQNMPLGSPEPPVESLDAPFYNLGCFRFYGEWRLVSIGPDRNYRVPGAPMDCFNPNPAPQKGSDIPYDPTNGTVSPGNILRTQRLPEGGSLCL